MKRIIPSTLLCIALFALVGCETAPRISEETPSSNRESPIPKTNENPWLAYQPVEDYVKQKGQDIQEELNETETVLFDIQEELTLPNQSEETEENPKTVSEPTTPSPFEIVLNEKINEKLNVPEEPLEEIPLLTNEAAPQNNQENAATNETITQPPSSQENVEEELTEAALALRVCEQQLEEIFSEAHIRPPSRDSNPPLAGTQSKKDLTASLQLALSNNLSDAVAQAAQANYSLCSLDNLLIWQPAQAGTGLPLLALRQEIERPVIVQIPHPFFEAHTLDQGLQAIRDFNALAVIVSGRHRCASLSYSQCDGQTSVCDTEKSNFRLSDPAHHSGALFHIMSEVIASAYRNAQVVSIHGMSQDGISLSNGTKDTTNATTAVARLHQAFQERFVEENISTCNAYNDVEANYRYCGTTNIQGRAINGSANACVDAAEQASNRFIHIEQSRTLREEATPEILRVLFNTLSE